MEILKGLKFYRFIKITKRIDNFLNGKPHCPEFHMLYYMFAIHIMELRDGSLNCIMNLRENNTLRYIYPPIGW